MGAFCHDDRMVHRLYDFREDTAPPPGLANLYYAVLRIKFGHAIWYYHTALAIDDHLPSHIEAIKCIVRSGFKWQPVEINCVFARSLVMLDSVMMDDRTRQFLAKELKAVIAKGPLLNDQVERFSVTGFVENDNISAVLLDANDAQDAYEIATALYASGQGEELRLFDIIGVSPAIPEIVARFDRNAPKLIELVKAPSAASGS